MAKTKLVGKTKPAKTSIKTKKSTQTPAAEQRKPEQ